MKLLAIIGLFFLLNNCHAQNLAVVELFTSEGCSSCPPADELLSKITQQFNGDKKVIALAYHVDYWNRLGWKDPYSKNQFTLRQENYSRVTPEKELYTPQAIINGTYSFTGSDSKKMNEFLDKAFSTPLNKITFKIDSTANDSAYISYQLKSVAVNDVLRIAITENGLSSKVGKGENKGKELHHDNVVRVFYSVDKPQQNGRVAVPLKGIKLDSKKINLVLFVQHKQTFKITAAGE